MTSKAKIKGNSWERDLAKFLRVLFGGSFIRVPNSGAFIGGSNAHRKESMSANQILAAKGDLQTPDFMPKLVLECKFYADFAWHSLLTPGNVPQLDGWIDQTKECIEAGDLWMVAFKINRRGTFICMDYATAYDNNFVLGNHSIYSNDNGKYIVTDLTELFEKNKDVILKLSA